MGRKKLLEMLEETMEAEEDGEAVREASGENDAPGETNKTNGQEGEEDVEVEEVVADRELAPLPQAGEFPMPLSSSSRADLVVPPMPSMAMPSMPSMLAIPIIPLTGTFIENGPKWNVRIVVKSTAVADFFSFGVILQEHPR